MKLPKIIEKSVLNSDNVKQKIEIEKSVWKKQQDVEFKKIKDSITQSLKTEYNKEVVKEVNKALEAARKDWSLETVKALDRKFGASRKYISTSGPTDTFSANDYSSGKNYSTLGILYSDSPGSIPSAFRIRDAVIGGGYVIKPEVGGIKGKRSDLKRLIDFFDRPNPDDTIETLIQVGVENYLGYGNWYMEKVPTKGSKGKKETTLAELYNLDPVKMSILVDADLKKKGVLQKAGYKQTTESNKSIIYTKSEICHIKRPHRRADLYGRAVLEDNMAMLQLLMRALTYNTNILKNGGRPPLQLILPKDSIEADAEAVSAFWEKNYQGPHNAGKTLVSFKGAEAKALGITPQDMAYLELLNYGLKLVAGQFGVPLFMIGFPESANRASSAEGRRYFYLSNIFILRKLISQKITQEIIKDGLHIEGWKFDFRTAGLEEAESSRRDFMTGWTKGLYSFNDARIAVGLLPIEEAWANKFYLMGSKNDSLIEIKDAIGRSSDQSAPDSADIKPGGKPGDANPNNDDRVAEPKRPSDGQGQ
jgi:HK97 family phage portal protein